jgi:hypothetical protein
MRIKAVDLAQLLGCSVSAASKLITTMNQELKDKGYLTIRGSIPKDYAYERLRIKEES